MPELYNEKYSLIREDPRVNDPQMFHYARTIDRLARMDSRAPTILDVGCGSGKFLYAYSQVNGSAQLNGLEINPDTVAKVRQGFPDFNFYVGYETVPDAQFDVVCSWNVIEHVPDPGAFLHELAKHARVGGVIAISTPNHTMVNRWRQGIDRWETINPPLHLCILSRPALHRMFQQCVLKCVHLSTFSWDCGGRLDQPRWWKPKYYVPFVLGRLRLGGNLLMIGRKLACCD